MLREIHPTQPALSHCPKLENMMTSFEDKLEDGEGDDVIARAGLQVIGRARRWPADAPRSPALWTRPRD